MGEMPEGKPGNITDTNSIDNLSAHEEKDLDHQDMMVDEADSEASTTGLTAKPYPKHKVGSHWQRKMTASRIKLARNLDFTKMGQKRLEGHERIATSIGDSTLHAFNTLWGIDLASDIKRMYKREKAEHEPVRVLDIGMGASTVLQELKKKLGSRIEAHAIDVKRYYDAKGVTQRVGHVQQLLKRFEENSFDIIMDNRGGLLWTWDKSDALNQVYSALAPGGRAYIQPNPGIHKLLLMVGLPWTQSWFKRWQKETGAIVRQEGPLKDTGQTILIEKPIDNHWELPASI